MRLDLAADRVDVWIEEVAAAKWGCPECGRTVPLYDHAEERQWRHLDTCHCQTYVHARLPRVQCPEHGVRQVAANWAGPGSAFTVRMEGWLIDTLGMRRDGGDPIDGDELGCSLGHCGEGGGPGLGPEAAAHSAIRVRG